MISDSQAALKVAEFLLKIKAVRLNLEEPFTWASGWKSPIYCDNRLVLSYPEIRTFIRQEFVQLIEEKFSSPDVIVGVATGGIAMGALIAQELGLPFAYVRSDSKGHGMKNRVEGEIALGDTVVVIEDLISTGGSSLSAVEALRESGAVVKGMAAIFTYGFSVSKENFKSANVDLCTLTDFQTLSMAAVNSNYIEPSQIEALEHWRRDPSSWAVLKS
ncbi:MAG: orotate phosphoribosyltransferase [Flavobacteriales bacterium]|nr:orotate phosphoribosyltransferase [Flavobacteriales bacterium]